MRILTMVAALLWLHAPTVAAEPQAAAAPSAGSPQPTEKPFLWMTETTPPSFLYGTIHLPDKRVLALPDVVTEAFNASDALYTEIPMDPETMAKAVAAFVLPEGQTLTALLPEDLYARTDAYMQARGIGLAVLDGMSPMLVAIQLMTLDYLAVMQTTPALDAMLYARAGKAGKELGSVETIDEQIDMFRSLTVEDQIEMLDSTLEFLETSDVDVVDALVEEYVRGDGADLMDLMFSYMDPSNEVHARFTETLFAERDVRMSERIATLLAENPDRSYFIAVGAGHFFGEDGILNGLAARDVAVKRLAAADVEAVEEAAALPH